MQFRNAAYKMFLIGGHSVKIIFTHFGNTIPKHLVANVLRTRDLFPNIQLVLLVEEECVIPKNIEKFRFRISKSADWIRISEGLNHPKDFRDNFWFTSLARFLALGNYMNECPGEFLHVESDVILAQDFPFEKFSEMKNPIAFPILSQTHGIASTLYIRDFSSIDTLVELCYSSAKSDPLTTDMLILRKLFDKCRQSVLPLPIGPGDARYFSELIDPSLIEQFEDSVDWFGGIFDGLDLGYYLFGIDPRNHKGIRYLRRLLPNHYLQVDKIDFRFSDERNFPNVVVDNANGRELPVFSLHIHSKNLKLFSSKSGNMTMKIGCDSYRFGPGKQFVFRIFFQACVRALRKRILIVFTTRK